jgi:glycosyltransferase involved in cell wall biosynthesis
MERVFIVMAALNEETNVGKVVAGLQASGYKNIVVIDDGSADATSKVAEEAGALVLRHVINRGQGAALRTGIDYALAEGADYIVTFDSDGQHRVEDLQAMLDPVLSGEVDVTLGSRFLKPTDMPLSRKILLKGSLIVQNVFYGIKMTDVHNGFRVLSRKAAQQLDFKPSSPPGMEHSSEIVDIIHKKKIKFKEVPVVIKYSKEIMQHGKSSFAGAFRILFKMIVRKMKV